jgi:hypothetical protein
MKFDAAAEGIAFTAATFTEKGPVLAYELAK